MQTKSSQRPPSTKGASVNVRPPQSVQPKRVPSLPEGAPAMKRNANNRARTTMRCPHCNTLVSDETMVAEALKAYGAKMVTPAEFAAAIAEAERAPQEDAA